MTTAEQLADEIYGLHCDIGRLEQENARLKELIYDRAHKHAIQHMTEDELRITTANALDENAKLRELVAILMYAKPRDMNSVRHNGRVVSFDELLAEVGMQWKDECAC